MPKLRHITLAAEDPFAAADFYNEAFGFTEVRRTERRASKVALLFLSRDFMLDKGRK
jgi:catechol 2,3-dioxygenase-like lactoylglutathione lyase family enzyme